MYSLEVIRQSIESSDTSQLVARWEKNMFSDEARPIAEAELRKRGIDPQNPVLEVDYRPSVPVSDFSLSDISPVRRLFTFKGRASRLKFWLVVPAAWVFFIFIRVLLEVLFERVSYPVLLISVFGPLIPIAWVHWATVVQRLHDRNKSGSWAGLLFVPFFGQLWALIELGLLKGSAGANRYGRAD